MTEKPKDHPQGLYRSMEMPGLMTEDLVERLRRWGEHGISGSFCDLVEAADRIEALEAENDSLKAIVWGWHYLAVGPDEMGDYITQRRLIEASEPYADPELMGFKGVGDE